MAINKMQLPLLAVNRHRINQDGEGVFTLVACANCPVSCKYCINRKVLNSGKIENVTPTELYNRVKIDNLYFLATGGGVTFGGGEPLLYSDFILEFARLVDKAWKINIETSLNVNKENLSIITGIVDNYYVDIKDMNNNIYSKYTGGNNEKVIENLKYLYESDDRDKVIIRIPLIEGYNTQDDILKSTDILKKMGFRRFDYFSYVLPTEISN